MGQRVPVTYNWKCPSELVLAGSNRETSVNCCHHAPILVLYGDFTALVGSTTAVEAPPFGAPML